MRRLHNTEWGVLEQPSFCRWRKRNLRLLKVRYRWRFFLLLVQMDMLSPKSDLLFLSRGS